jgi:branched-chain amino acid transport system permease protein
MIEIFLDIIILFCIYAIITLSLNLQHGYTGIFNLGLYFPILVGAMITAYVPGRLAMLLYGIDSRLDYSYNNPTVIDILKNRLIDDPIISITLLFVTVFITIIVCYVLGYLTAYPALKLPADYLALFMLCLSESTRVIGMQTDWLTGGVFGIMVINPFWWLGQNSYYGLSIFIIIATLCVCLIINKVCMSPLGRLLKGIRENELTAECVGKDVKKVKRQVLSSAFVILGLAGVLHAFWMGAVVAGGYTRVDFSYWPWLMMIVGGAGNNLGVLFGAFILVLIRRAMIVSKHAFSFLPFSVVWLEPILLALMLMATLMFRPEGILPERPQSIRDYMKKVLKLES